MVLRTKTELHSKTGLRCQGGGKGHLLLFSIAVVALMIGIVVTSAPLQRASKNAPRELLAPPLDIQYFTFGHRDLLADTFWLRSIQDFDYCENKLKEHLCRGQGWLYQMLDVITNLSPTFRMAYSAGSMALTVIISDIEGASKFFDKAVRQFPDDWILLYKAAYHAIYEEKNPAKAADLVERAAKHGAPEWVYALAGRLYSQSGRAELAEGLARQLEATGGDPAVIAEIRKRAARPEAFRLLEPAEAPQNESSRESKATPNPVR